MLNDVSFDIIGKKGILLDENRHRACYSDIMGGNVQEDAYKIVLYYATDAPYTEEEVKRWVKDVKSWGFPCKYKGIHDELGYTIVLPVRKTAKTSYKSKLHFASALNLFRYIRETYVNKIPRMYFEICDAVGKDVDKFAAMQIANFFASRNTNYHHMLMHGTPVKSVMSLEEAKKGFAKDKKSIYNYGSPGCNDFWNGAQLNIGIPSNTDANNLKQFYNKIMNNEQEKTKVYVVGGDTNYANWLPNIELTDTVASADVVLFTGGEDVHPSLYDEPMGEHTGSNLARDMREKKIFEEARDMGKKLLGICRGSQFLCVMAGGKLVQHQQNKYSEHPITLVGGQEIFITSTHHQAAYPYKMRTFDYDILGWTNNISAFHLDGKEQELNPRKECEIVKYRNINALGIQGHPEFKDYQRNHADSLKRLQKLFTDFLNNNI